MPTIGSMTSGRFGGGHAYPDTPEYTLLGTGFASVMDLCVALEKDAKDTLTIPPRTTSITLNSNTLNIEYAVRRGNYTISTDWAPADWFSSNKDTRASVVVVTGNLTIDSGAVFAPPDRRLFWVIYVTGNLTVNGSVSMTARGANHSGTGDSGFSSVFPAFDIPVCLGTFNAIPSGYGTFPSGAAYTYYRLICTAVYDVAAAISEFKLFASTENGAMTTNSSNGLVASASTIFGTAYDAWMAFSKNYADMWVTPSFKYTAATGAYLGSATTTVNGTAVLGEWIQLGYSTAQTLVSYSLSPRSGLVSQLPMSFVLAGSNNQTAWNLVDSRNSLSPSIFSYGTDTSFAPPPATYTYFRLIITSTFSVTTPLIYIARMKLFTPTENSTMTSNSSNGLVASASTVTSGSYPAWGAFGLSGGGAWGSASTYATGTGAYTGAVSTTVSGSAVLGEWLQLQYSTTQTLSAYSLIPSGSRDAMPQSYVLAGSTDGSTWTTIDSRTIASSDAWVFGASTTFYSTSYADNTVNPKIPASGGAGTPQNLGLFVPAASPGVLGGTGGGGAGAWDATRGGTANGSHGGAGAAGTAFCGGSGSGAGSSLDAGSNGGAGSAAVVTGGTAFGTGGGAGNPGGLAGGTGGTGCGGTLVVIARGILAGSGTITSAGSKGGNGLSSSYNIAGGGSGGGSVTVMYGTDGGLATPSAPGGDKGRARISGTTVTQLLADERWCGSKGGDGSARKIPLLAQPYLAAFSSLMDVGAALAIGAADPAGITPRSFSPSVGGTVFPLECTVRRGNFAVGSSWVSTDWFTSVKDTVAACIVVDGNLTIDSGVVFTPPSRKLFTYVYVTGSLINNGSISMTARGANHSGTGDSAGYVAPADIPIIAGTYNAVPTGYGTFAPPAAAYSYFRLIVTSTFSITNNRISLGEMKLFTPTENGAMTSNNSNGLIASSSTDVAWKAFDKNVGNYWFPSGGYTLGTGAYAGAASTTVNGSAVLGDWLQIQYSMAQTLGGYSLAPPGGLYRDSMPQSYVLAGSINGTTWVTIDSRTLSSSDAWVPAGDTMFYSTSYVDTTVNPKIPANGGAGCPQQTYITPPPGSSGILGGTGGGGAGCWDSAHFGTVNGSHGGAGAGGTAFCGGSGAGGGNALDAIINGGGGSAGYPSGAGGGAGNPGGAGSTTGSSGCGGTLIVIARGTVSGSGNITSAGSKGGDALGGSYNAGGGGSGGGSVTVMYGTDGGLAVPTAPGGARGFAKIAGTVVVQLSGDERWCGSKGGDGSARKIPLLTSVTPALTFASLMDVGSAIALGSADPAGMIPRMYSPVIGGTTFPLECTVRRGNYTVGSSWVSTDWFTSVKDTVAACVVVDGNLTIDSGVVFTPPSRKLFTVVYVTGNLTVNGSVSMTARGANHSGTGDSGFSSVFPAADIPIAAGTYTASPSKYVFPVPAAYKYYRFIVQSVYKSVLTLNSATAIIELRLFAPTENGAMTSNNSNGLIASASSILSGSYDAYRAFDKTATGWSTPNSKYSTTTGLYTGAVSTTVSGNAVLGEWVQLQYSAAQTLASYTYSTQVGGQPYAFVLAGSTDGTTWTTVDSRTAVLPVTSPTPDLGDSLYYNFYSSTYTTNIANPKVPATGGAGGSGMYTGSIGNNGIQSAEFSCGSGGGGVGGIGGTGVAPGGSGAAGTSFGGGPGGGGSIDALQGGSGTANGGAGGAGCTGYEALVNGAGNPTGGTAGTLVVICRGDVSGTGTLISNGSVGYALAGGGAATIGGGSSGGGSVVLAYKTKSGTVSLQADGAGRAQMTGGGDSRGGLGGNGSAVFLAVP